ncbi:MAG: uroporphyrinogen-III C-methyltransferase [Rhodobacter sp.]|nr:uroporphyrinogen-III C-methyltransferase [Paracoccaceae bacterium]MCC0080339.1 uroporphyrinogen-III C-methyltransferase [Rhodobacter sp.]
MQHFPIYLDLADARVAIAGNGAFALAKLRLLARTPARITLFAPAPEADLESAAADFNVALVRHEAGAAHLAQVRLAYAAHGDAVADARFARLARAAGALVNVVDNLEASDYITPAIVDRAPVTVAIGTEGAAPVLARAIKTDLEDRLPQGVGPLARAGKLFRPRAELLPQGRRRRDFWADYYFRTGPQVLAEAGEELLDHALHALLEQHLNPGDEPGRVDLVGAGPGDPDLMTLKARRLLDAADVVIHDRLVPQAILDLARREALFVPVGKQGFGPSTPQDDINAAMIAHAQAGARVVRLKGGDASVFARLDEETDALSAAGIAWAVTPGITAASAAAAAIGRSLTRRGRNADLRLMTAHDMQGYAEHDWQTLAMPGAVAAVYMGKKAARFLQGRLMMHGAAPTTPVTLVENAARPDQRIIASRLDRLAADAAQLTGPAILLFGLGPARAEVHLPQLIEDLA